MYYYKYITSYVTVELYFENSFFNFFYLLFVIQLQLNIVEIKYIIRRQKIDYAGMELGFRKKSRIILGHQLTTGLYRSL